MHKFGVWCIGESRWRRVPLMGRSLWVRRGSAKTCPMQESLGCLGHGSWALHLPRRGGSRDRWPWVQSVRVARSPLQQPGNGERLEILAEKESNQFCCLAEVAVSRCQGRVRDEVLLDGESAAKRRWNNGVRSSLHWQDGHSSGSRQIPSLRPLLTRMYCGGKA